MTVSSLVTIAGAASTNIKLSASTNMPPATTQASTVTTSNVVSISKAGVKLSATAPQAYTVTSALAAYQAKTLSSDSPITITDLSSAVTTNLTDLIAMNKAGLISALTFSNKTPTLSIDRSATIGPLDDTIGLLAKINSAYKLNVSNLKAGEAGSFSNLPATATVNLSVTDTADAIGSNLDKLQSLAAAKKLSSLEITQQSADQKLQIAFSAIDTAGGNPHSKPSDLPASIASGKNLLLIKGSQLTSASAALNLMKTGSYSLIVNADAKTLQAAATDTRTTLLIAADTGANLSAKIGSVSTAVAKNKLVFVSPTDNSPIAMTEAQLTAFQTSNGGLNFIAPRSQAISVTSVSAADVNRISDFITNTGKFSVGSISVSDSIANIVNNLDSLENAVKNGLVQAINVSSGTSVSITSTTFKKDLDALKMIKKAYNLSISDLSAVDAVSFAPPSSNAKTTITVSDTAENLNKNISALTDLVSKKKVTAISVSDSQALTSKKSEYDILKSVISPITSTKFNITNAAIADLSSLVSSANIIKISINDSSANIVKKITSLESANAQGKLSALNIMDSTPANFSISIANRLKVINGFSVVNGYNIVDTGDNIVSAARYDVGQVIKNAVSLSLTSAANNLNVASAVTLSNLTNLASSAKYSITDSAAALTDQLSLDNEKALKNAASVATADVVNFATAIKLFGSKKFIPNQKYIIQDTAANILAALSLSSNSIVKNASAITVSDTKQNVLAAMDKLEVYSKTDQIQNIKLTDQFGSLQSLTDAQLKNDADAIGRINSSISARTSTPAKVTGANIQATGFDFGDAGTNRVTIITDPSQYFFTREGGAPAASGSNPPYWGKDMFSISVDGSSTKSISIRAGTYNGTQLATEMTRAISEAFSGKKYINIFDTYRRDGGSVVFGNDIMQLNLSRLAEDGSTVQMVSPIEIDLLGVAGSAGTPPVAGAPQPDNRLQLTPEALVVTVQSKLNDALNARHIEFGKPATWPDSSNPPIVVGYDTANRALTFKVDPNQLGATANEPSSRFNSLRVYNPTAANNSLGIPALNSGPSALIRADSSWTGNSISAVDDPIIDPLDQRTGVIVNYNENTRQFSFSSGTTGQNSSIKLGRSILATNADVTPQVNSYDFSSMNFAAPHTVTIESNGRTLTYNYIPSITNSAYDSTSFFGGLQQAMPVTTSSTQETQKGSATSNEVQIFSVNGSIMNGDKFTFTLAPSPFGPPVSLNIDALVIPPYSNSYQRLNSLFQAIYSAMANYNSINRENGIFASFTQSGNQFNLTYALDGVVPFIASLKQTVRGSDNGLPPIPLTDPTTFASQTSVINGTSTFPTVQSISLADVTGRPAKLNTGDIYRISMPLADGSVFTRDVRLMADGMSGLTNALNSSGWLPAVFSYSSSGTTLISTYQSSGAITGSLSLQQIAVGGIRNGSVSSTQVRPANLGPLSINYTGPNLEITGDPSGDLFAVTLRVDGVIKSMSPVGAQGSTSRSSLQIGQALGQYYSGSNDLLGIGQNYLQKMSSFSGFGLKSSPAVVTGSSSPVFGSSFKLDASTGDTRISVKVDGLFGAFNLAEGIYTGASVASAIQDQINQIKDVSTGRWITGVQVSFDSTKNSLVFTSGSTGDTADISVIGPSKLGLSVTTKTKGSDSIFNETLN